MMVSRDGTDHVLMEYVFDDEILVLTCFVVPLQTQQKMTFVCVKLEGLLG